MGIARNSILVLSIFFFLFYFIAAWYLAQERTFLDATFYLFHLLQNKWFVIEHQRFVLAFSQFLPLVGILLGFKLKTIIILYSINQFLFPFFIWLFLFFVVKDYYSSIAIILMMVCGVYFLFYCPMYEIWYGCYLLIFWNSLLIHGWQLKPYKSLFFYLVLVTILFAHPLLFIGALFVLILHYLNGHRFKLHQFILLLICFGGWFLIKKFFLTDYEGGKLSYQMNLRNNKAYLQLFSFDYFQRLFLFLAKNYIEVFIFSIISGLYLIYKRAYLKFLICIGFLVGFILLINVSHANAVQHTNYFERMYLLMVPLALIPFYSYVLPGLSLRSMRWVLICSLLIICFKGIQIISHHNWYLERIAKMKKVISAAQLSGISKVLLKEDKENLSLFEWSLPMESIIISSIYSKETVTISNDIEIAELIKSKGIGNDEFRLRFEILMKDKDLNPAYFSIKQGNYRTIN